MAEDITVAPGVRIPAAALDVRAVRASGPGGQNVNKVASKIELVVDVLGIEGLDDRARQRLRSAAGRRLDAEGRIHLTSQESRDRHRNLETAREKARVLVSRAIAVPKTRRATRPSAAKKEERLRAKKRDAAVKAGRRAKDDD